MKGIWGISVIAAVLILGGLGFSQDVYAPPPQKPEKIKLDSVSWDNESQEFVFDISLHCAFATAGQHANFSIQAEITIEPSSGVKEIVVVGSKVKDVVRSDSCNQSDDQFAKVKVKFPWNRNDGKVEGEAKVTVKATIQNPAGNSIVDIKPGINTITIEIDFQEPPQISILHGTVTNSVTSGPLDLVDVSVSKDGVLVASVQTFLTGEYLVSLEQGVHSVLFEKEGFSSENLAITIVPGVNTLDAALEPNVCQEDNDCADNHVCNEGICVPPPPVD